MDRMSVVLFLGMMLLMAGLAYMVYTQPRPEISVPKTGPGSVIQVKQMQHPNEYVFHVGVAEGYGPNPKAVIPDANVIVYYDANAIKYAWDVPSDAQVLARAVTGSDGVAVVNLQWNQALAIGNKIPLYFVAEANGYYPGVAEKDMNYEIPANLESIPVSVTLDKIGTLGWTADDAFRGTDGPVLRYKTTDEDYVTIFQIKPQIDFETGKVSGLWYVQKVYLEEDVNADLTNVATIDAKIGDVEFSDVTPSELPKYTKLDTPVKVTAENPLNVQITVTTKDGTASLTSGAPLLVVKLEDVLGNTYSVHVKVA